LRSWPISICTNEPYPFTVDEQKHITVVDSFDPGGSKINGLREKEGETGIMNE
jgi:hypothetical protein